MLMTSICKVPKAKTYNWLQKRVSKAYVQLERLQPSVPPPPPKKRLTETKESD